MSLTLSTTLAHLEASGCSFKAFSSSSNRHSKMEEIWDTCRDTHEMNQRETHILHWSWMNGCWSLAPLWRTCPQVWGWMIFRCCSSSGLIRWLCSPARDAWHDGSSARWRPRASLHVHIARVELPSGTSAPLWKWGGLEDLSVEQTERKNTVERCVKDQTRLIDCVAVEEPEAGSPWGSGELSSYPPTDAAGSVMSLWIQRPLQDKKREQINHSQKLGNLTLEFTFLNLA